MVDLERMKIDDFLHVKHIEIRIPMFEVSHFNIFHRVIKNPPLQKWISNICNYGAKYFLAEQQKQTSTTNDSYRYG